MKFLKLLQKDLIVQCIKFSILYKEFTLGQMEVIHSSLRSKRQTTRLG